MNTESMPSLADQPKEEVTLTEKDNSIKQMSNKFSELVLKKRDLEKQL